MFKTWRWAFKGDELTISGGDEKERATVKVRPGEIDVTSLTGTNKGKTTEGIYRVEKGKVVIALRDPGLGRPKEYEGGKGAGVITLERAE